MGVLEKWQHYLVLDRCKWMMENVNNGKFYDW